MKKHKIVFITTLYSPFQVELAREINSLGLEYHVIFTMNLNNKLGENSRAAHWQPMNDYSKRISHIYSWKSVADLASNLEEELSRIRPDLILASGILSSPIFAAIKRLKVKRSISCPLGFWLESPNTTTGTLKAILKKEIVRYQLRHMDFAFAIGSNALNYYSSISPMLPIYDVPYGQDFEGFWGINRDTNNGCVKFLFSGQLLQRNNIKSIVKALFILNKSRSKRWQLIVSGAGPEENLLKQAANELFDKDWTPILFFREFKDWEDRISSFKSSDVLICPSLHAGWGLVIPEAVASGMPVITTEFVNSARRFVVPGFNGLVVQPDPQSIAQAMEFFIDNPSDLLAMGERGRPLSITGEASFVAKLFHQNIKLILAVHSPKRKER
jgi:glycosyltransferase involved in cell wall biosynthesis